jgi:hypothetical protein
MSNARARLSNLQYQDIMRTILRDALDQKRTGVNLLIHGNAGTGRTIWARQSDSITSLPISRQLLQKTLYTAYYAHHPAAAPNTPSRPTPSDPEWR